jgi:hypothetical protein
MEIEFQKKWDELKRLLDKRFEDDLDVQAILFIIGLQELGMKVEKLSKDQKVDVMHVAVCAILEPYGYYEYEGRDKDDWPHWKAAKKLPRLNQREQEILMKQGIIEYLEENSTLA